MVEYDPYIQGAGLAEMPGGGKTTQAKRDWMALRFGLFLHFGINTFNDAEWSDGTLDPATYNPTAFDADQWLSAAKAAGAKYILFTTKHHDGFCNWPTDTTDYSVKSTPWGKDTIELVAEACRKHDIALGFYYSLWDRHAPCYADDHAYAKYMKRHLAELLTRYGPVVELWFDGGWKKGAVHVQDAERWYWREIYEACKAIQPEVMIGNNGTTERPGEIITWPCDLRFGEKTVPPADDRKVWWTGTEDTCLPYESQYTLSTGGTGEGQFADGKWFWHADDDTVQDPKWVADTIKLCNERGGNFVINAGPSAEGLLRVIDVDCLNRVGALRGGA